MAMIFAKTGRSVEDDAFCRGHTEFEAFLGHPHGVA